MKKTQKIKKLDAILGKQELSRNEMKLINGGFPCYCNGVYKGDYSSICACSGACGVGC